MAEQDMIYTGDYHLTYMSIPSTSGSGTIVWTEDADEIWDTSLSWKPIVNTSEKQISGYNDELLQLTTYKGIEGEVSLLLSENMFSDTDFSISDFEQSFIDHPDGFVLNFAKADTGDTNHGVVIAVTSTAAGAVCATPNFKLSGFEAKGDELIEITINFKAGNSCVSRVSN